MGMRRKSREILLQLLFQAEVNSEKDPVRLLEALPHFKKTTAAIERASELFLKILEKKEELDQFIEKYAANWRLSRMSHIDRNILRYAAYELVYCEDIPKEVVLDEAIEIAKAFGTEESGAFVNGILDRISQHAVILNQSTQSHSERPDPKRSEGEGTRGISIGDSSG